MNISSVYVVTFSAGECMIHFLLKALCSYSSSPRQYTRWIAFSYHSRPHWTSECSLTWRWGLCRCNNLRWSHTGEGGTQTSDYCPCKKAWRCRPDRKHSHRKTRGGTSGTWRQGWKAQVRRPPEAGGGGNQGPPRASGGARQCQHLLPGHCEGVSVASSRPICAHLLQQEQETGPAGPSTSKPTKSQAFPCRGAAGTWEPP